MATLPIIRSRRQTKAEQAKGAAQKAGSTVVRVAGDGYSAVKGPAAVIAIGVAGLLALTATAIAIVKRKRRPEGDPERPLGPVATAQAVSPPQPDRQDRTPPTGDALAGLEGPLPG